MTHRSKTSSSQVSWALLTEGVTKSRVEVHRLKLLLDRALILVDQFEAKEHLWQVAGDIIQGVPERLAQTELALDRTAYALVLMGEDFLRGRLPLDDRRVVDDGIKTTPLVEKESLASRVARRHLAGEGVAPSAEFHFFDGPKNREVREFALSKALTNYPSEAAVAVRHMDNTDTTPGKAKKDAEDTPPTPLVIEKKPGGKQFSTLNRYLIETEQPGVSGVPEGRGDIPKHPILKTRSSK